MRFISALFIAVVLMVLPSIGQEASDTPWQDSITGQIEAFRAEDGPAALEFAGQGFRTQFEAQPDAFYPAIIATGYEPIVRSRSHTFGTFNQISDTVVIQIVNLVGPDQGLFQALYQVANEPDVGWRVQGVVLKREAGVGI